MKKLIILLVLSFSFIAQSQIQIVSEGKYSIQNVTFNSKYSDFGTTFSEKGLIFASERDTGFSAKRRHKINDELRPFLQLFEFDEIGNVRRMRSEINQKYHESTAAITQDGQTMFFTRNNTDFEGKLRVSEENISLLKLYKASKDATGNWGEGRPISFCSDNYSVAHPSLSKDGMWMYFASDMPGGRGNSDIYRAPISKDGILGIPENLGPTVNSDSSDSFPFISESGDLYFASDRPGGIGGLDLYVVHEETNMSIVSNLGTSINSISDDFGLILLEQMKSGYFSSNRDGGMGSDDIYSFTEESPFTFDCIKKWNILVLDKETNEPIVDPLVKIISLEDIDVVLSKENNMFNVEASCDAIGLNLAASKQGYENGNTNVILNELFNNEIRITLQKKKNAPHAVGMDLGKVLGLIPINFASNKWNILPEAALTLQKLIDYMKMYPTVKVEIGSHTDARGSDSHNQKLSQNRANSTAKYIIENGGINASRLIAKGYGESRLLNTSCSNGKKCSNAEHLKNRRSEFIVIEN